MNDENTCQSVQETKNFDEHGDFDDFIDRLIHGKSNKQEVRMAFSGVLYNEVDLYLPPNTPELIKLAVKNVFAEHQMTQMNQSFCKPFAEKKLCKNCNKETANNNEYCDSCKQIVNEGERKLKEIQPKEKK